MKKQVQLYTSILVIAALFLMPLIAYAGPASPFVGHWGAIDLDGSHIRLSIGGPPEGPFRITSTDSYISFCNGEAGIIRGTGVLNEADAYLLEADLHVECFKSGESLDFHLTFRYHPLTNTLSSRDSNGMVIVWHRPGQLPAPPPILDLRVNYGHDWVESFYEAGHMVWITVTESDGVMVKATAEVLTEPKDFWGGETGFQTNTEDWNPAPPDIQPYDWVYAWVDNGASAQVQIGEISGAVDLAADSIAGAIYAPWFSDLVEVECHPWGAPDPVEMKFDTVLPDGADPYACSWAGEWDIQPYQDVGVGYFGHDGHWVANAITSPNPRIVASEAGDWFWVTEFYPGLLDLFIYESVDEGATLLWSGQQEAVDLWGITVVESDVHGLDLLPGNYLVVSDGVNGKGLVLETISMQVFDTENEIVAGTAPAGRDVTVVAGMAEAETQAIIYLTADPISGAWLADFSTIPFDITEDMRPWSFAHIFDEDGDANEAGTPPPPPNTRFTVWPEWSYLEGYEWPDGAVVSISVDGKEICSTEAVSGFPEWDPSNTFFSVNFPEGCSIVPGDLITLSSETLSLSHQVAELTIIEANPDNDTVSGVAVFDPEQYLLHTWIHGVDESYMQLSAEGGAWLADFGSQGIDLQAGMGGRVELVDQSSNATAAEWYIPNPRFTVWPESDHMDGGEWPDGPVTVTVEGKPECSTVKISEGGYFNEPFPEGCDISVGDVVTFTDGVTIRSHTVRNLAVTAVDQALDIVAGTADIGEGVSVGAYDFGGESELQLTAEDGTWLADFASTGIDLVDGMCGYARVDDEVGNVTQVDWCVLRSVTVGNFYVEWSQSNPEEVVYLSWNGSGNLTNPWVHPYCPDEDSEFFGNSWVSENEGEPSFFFATLVGWGTTGAWTPQTAAEVYIDSISSGCPGSADIPITTQYGFYDDGLRANLITVERTFDFGTGPFDHAVRPFIPRLYPKDGFTQVLHPDASGATLVSETTDGCGFGCMRTDWNETWFAIHDPVAGLGMIVQHEPSTSPVALWVDDDDGSFTNSSSILMLQPPGGFTGLVTDIEHLCFYNASIWTPSLILPEGCSS